MIMKMKKKKKTDDDNKCEDYSLCVKMIVHIPRFGELKAR
jgi:hypothetical protein